MYIRGLDSWLTQEPEPRIHEEDPDAYDRWRDAQMEKEWEEEE